MYRNLEVKMHCGCILYVPDKEWSSKNMDFAIEVRKYFQMGPDMGKIINSTYFHQN